MDKRVLLIAFHFPPQATSSGIQRTLGFSKYLGRHGWEPMVLSAKPMAYGVKNSSLLKTLPRELMVRRTFALDAKRHMGILGRYPMVLSLPDRWVSWCLSAIPNGLDIVRRYKPTVIWSTFPIATAPLIAMAIHRITGLPWVADFRDPMLQTNFPERKMQRKTYEWVERQTIYKCQKAVFTTHAAMYSYMQRFPEYLHHKFAVIENGYDEESFSHSASAGCEAVESSDCLTLLHSGTLYADDRDPSAFFQAISSLKRNGKFKDSALRVILRATGNDDHFNDLINRYDIADVVGTAPSVPYAEALHEMRAVDGLIVFQGASVNAQIPAKIYEYLRARTPILGLLDAAGETARLLRKAGIPNISSMDSADEIASALERFILQVKQGKARIASNDFITALSRENRAADLARLLDEVAGAPDA